MTFSIIARCPKTKKFGSCIATGSPSVGGRGVIHAASNVGALSLQATAEGRRGLVAFESLRSGLSADEVFETWLKSDPQHDWRQMGVVDVKGHATAFTGAQARPWAGHNVGDQFVVLCNRVAHQGVLKAIAEAYVCNADQIFEERLVLAIEAGRDAGGQVDGQLSSALISYDDKTVPYVDLRVDLADDPIAELRRIFDWHKPLLDYYQARLDNPELPLFNDWIKGQQGSPAGGAAEKKE
jgi:uncharacterized Ntn-hydrolase superfamily protein